MNKTEAVSKKRIPFSSPQELMINEVFYSIQGESLFVGKPTVFLRTTGCNLRCTWCDTKYAYWHGKGYSIGEIIEKIHSYKTRYLCITGGEPLAQAGIYALFDTLLKEPQQRRWIISLETSGSFSVEKVPSEIIKVIDIKCPDSGESEKNLWENRNFLSPQDQIKFVIASWQDFLWAKENLLKYRWEQYATVLFSPVFGKISLLQLSEWILENELEVTLQTQLHKSIWPPETRGV